MKTFINDAFDYKTIEKDIKNDKAKLGEMWKKRDAVAKSKISRAAERLITIERLAGNNTC
jgi:hypothetical protein